MYASGTWTGARKGNIVLLHFNIPWTLQLVPPQFFQAQHWITSPKQYSHRGKPIPLSFASHKTSALEQQARDRGTTVSRHGYRAIF